MTDDRGGGDHAASRAGDAARVRDLIRPYAWTLPVVGLLGLTASLLEGAGVTLLIPMLNLLLTGTVANGSDWTARVLALLAPVPQDWRLYAIAATIFLLMLLKAGVQMIFALLSARIEGKVGADARQALSTHLFRLDYAFFFRIEPARIVRIVAEDTWRLSEAVGLVFSLAATALTIAVFSALLLMIQWQLFLLVGAGMLVMRFVQVVSTRRLERLSGAVSAANARLAARVLTSVTSVRLIRLFGQEAREQGRLTVESEGFRSASFAMHRHSERMAPIMEILQAALFVLVLLAAYRLGMTVATIGAFLILLYRMQQPVLNFNRYRLDLAALGGALREIDWLLAVPGPARSGDAEPVPATGDEIVRFDDVSFRYPDAGPAFAVDGLTVALRCGVATALIGGSGAGKSTFVNLLCGLLDPTAGRIAIGGKDLRRLDAAQWRSRIALAGQDLEMIDGTIADNIAYGAPNADRDAVEAAAQAVGADAFIAALPAGYDTPLGPRGTSLSGGQRQRIGLARALLRRPDMLILDEATNAVDGISERQIVDLLHDRRWFRSALVISHRRSTLAACEDGIVLDHGRIVESGPLDELDFYRTMDPATHGAHDATRNRAR